MRAAPDEGLLEARHFVEEDLGLFGRAESHHGFDHGAVIPGAVEEADFARIGQVRAIALEVPLARFVLGRLRKGHRTRAAGIEVLGEAADRAALAGRVTAFKEHDDLRVRALDPVLKLQKLDLQVIELLLIELVRVAVLVRIGAFAELVRKRVHVDGLLREEARLMRLLDEQQLEECVTLRLRQVSVEHLEHFGGRFFGGDERRVAKLVAKIGDDLRHRVERMGFDMPGFKGSHGIGGLPFNINDFKGAAAGGFDGRLVRMILGHVRTPF